MSEGKNRRMVKKSKNSDTMNIKVSTRDKDLLSKDNEININIDGQQQKKGKKGNLSANKTIKEVKEEKEIDDDIETRISKLKEKNKKCQKEIDSLNSQIKMNDEKQLAEILSLNKTISELDKTHNNISNINTNLLTKLKDLENQVSKKFEEKFKLAKIIERQKKMDNKRDINIEIKCKEIQKQHMEKYVENNQKQIKRLDKLLKANKPGKDKELDNELKSINEEIDKLQQEVDNLKKIEKEHESCKKKKNKLKGQYNVLSSDFEFESKKCNMLQTEVEKVIPTKIENATEAMVYGEKVRKEMLQKVKNKYSSKIRLFNYKSYNYLLNELNDNKEANVKKGSSYKSLQTSGEADLPNFSSYIKNDISCRIDAKTPKIFLFSQDEKEILKKLIPNEYYNNYNEKYNKAEKEINEIEEKFKENGNKKKKLFLDNIKCDAINLKLKEITHIKAVLSINYSKNQKKILDLNRKIKLLDNDIKKQDFLLNQKNKNNKQIKNRIIEVKKSKQLQTEE